MDFTTLLTHLEAGDTDKALETAKALKPKFEKTVADLSASDTKLADAISTRDKAKEKIKTLAGVFGIEADELTPDKAKELIKSNKGGEEYQADIDNLTKLLAEKDATHTIALAGKDELFRDKLLEIEISKIGLNADVVNDKALKTVIDSIKQGATLENGVIIYKDGDAPMRDSSGQPITVSHKMDTFKADTTNAYLFKATSNGGGGSKENGTLGTKKFNELNGGELSKLRKDNPAEYDRLKAERNN